MLLMKDIRIFLYELRAYLVYVKVVENSVPSVRKSCPSFSTSVPFVYYCQFMYVSLPFSFEEGEEYEIRCISSTILPI